MVTMLKNKCSVWKRIKFPTFWYNCYYFTWSDTYFIRLETLLINHPSYKDKRKVHPRTGHEGPEGEYMYSSTLTLTSALGGGWVVNATSQKLYSRERDQVPIVQGAGWAPERVWIYTVNIATGIRSPDRPTRSKSPFILKAHCVSITG